MPERVIEHITILLYALAAISGGLGGCAIAGHHILRGGNSRISYILAYGIIGVVFGVLTMAYGTAFGLNTESLDSVIGASILAGAAGSISLASANLSARLILQRLGVEVQVTVKRRGDE